MDEILSDVAPEPFVELTRREQLRRAQKTFREFTAGGRGIPSPDVVEALASLGLRTDAEKVSTLLGAAVTPAQAVEGRRPSSMAKRRPSRAASTS